MKKDQFLKIAKVKSLDEFYRKFPTEKSFLAKHGKELRKAQIGSYIGGEQGAGFQPVAFQDVYDQADYAVTGSTEQQRKEEAYRQAELAAAQKQGGGAGSGGGLGQLSGLLQQLPQMLGEGGGEGMGDIAAAFGGARKGKKINKAQVGSNVVGTPINLQPNPNTNYAWTNFNTQAPPVNPNQPRQYAMQTQGTPVPQGEIVPIGGPAVEEKQGGWMKQMGKYAGPAGKIVEGIQQLKEEKRALERANQARDVSGVVREAASSRPEETQRRYVRPEDITNTGEEFFPIYGARNGASVGGGEIMNTFAPNTLYDDLRYEPLSDSERYKQFMHGGRMHKAQDGFLTQFANAGGANATGQLLTGITGENAGGNLGGTIGGTAGMLIGGPAGKLVGQAAGQLIGAAIDRKPQQIKKAKDVTQRNIQATAMQQGMQGGQAQYSSFMENGGTTSPYAWMSHTWQPQVIATFGEHKVKDLLRSPKDADMLRAGGHLKEYTPPSAAAMSTERPNFQMGGELQTHWGGYAEPMSYNPYLPDGGETIMFRGQSHDESDGKGNTGIGITYGENPVEVERGEPAVKLKNGTSDDSSLVVFGNLKIPKLLSDPDAKGKNFKNYVAKLSKKEAKQNKLIDKSITAIDKMDVQTSFDRLKFNSLQASVMGANQKLKDIAQKKIDAAALQNAMNDTIEEYGLKTTDRGNIVAKLGKNILKAQGGVTTTKSSSLPIAEDKLEDITFDPIKGITLLEYSKLLPEVVVKAAAKKAAIAAQTPTPSSKKATHSASAKKTSFPKQKLYDYTSSMRNMPKDLFKPAEGISKQFMLDNPPPTIKDFAEKAAAEKTSSKFPWMTFLNQALPYLRPTDTESLDPSQLYGEMYALATNQLEPVQAQLFQPQLTTPYDVSLQDIMNENEATFRAQQRLMGYNPAAQAQLAAGKYSANQKILSEQFRLNQTTKNQAYKENRDLLNQSQLQNLATLDQQYARQAEAKSKTKATTQAALNSIAAKYAQNRLENRTLQAYENLYNYRFDAKGRAINMNSLVDFEGMVNNASSAQVAEYIKILEAKSKNSKKESAKNGSVVRALKNI